MMGGLLIAFIPLLACVIGMMVDIVRTTRRTATMRRELKRLSAR